MYTTCPCEHTAAQGPFPPLLEGRDKEWGTLNHPGMAAHSGHIVCSPSSQHQELWSEAPTARSPEEVGYVALVTEM